MTESGGAPGSWRAEVAEIFRLAGHEIRNSLNGAAVNAEVLRSRIAKGSVSAGLEPFAERAAGEIARSAELSAGISALASLVLAAAGDDGAIRGASLDAPARGVALTLSRADHEIPGDLRSLLRGIGYEVERSGTTVIFKGSAPNTANSNTHE